MLVVAMAVSLGLLAFALTVCRERRAAVKLALGLAAGFIGPVVCLVSFLPPVHLQALLNMAALPLLFMPRWGVLACQVASVGAFVAGWAVVGGAGIEARREFDRLREQYPFETPADRLPGRPPDTPPVFEPEPLVDAEGRYEERGKSAVWWFGSRTEQLRRLHEEQTAVFEQSMGFGKVRMLRPKPAAETLKDHGYLDESLHTADSSLDRMVQDDAIDFADPARWGYRRENKVAGFLPHALRRQPGPAKGWAVERVELVGLLLAPNPRVYVSASLPRMDEVGRMETRHPDGFESPALARLRSGEEMVHDEPVGRLLGAIRAAKQCLTCHGGDRGDLLGAFSYHLRPR